MQLYKTVNILHLPHIKRHVSFNSLDTASRWTGRCVKSFTARGYPVSNRGQEFQQQQQQQQQPEKQVY